MADIAMLVAEEYERRMKIAKKMMGEEATTIVKIEMGFGSIPKLKWVSSEFTHIRAVANKVLEPRTQMALEALSGFFSA